jgi:hypothetical protein
VTPWILCSVEAACLQNASQHMKVESLDLDLVSESISSTKLHPVTSSPPEWRGFLLAGVLEVWKGGLLSLGRLAGLVLRIRFSWLTDNLFFTVGSCLQESSS